jgi:amidophosphoribosyltransferase
VAHGRSVEEIRDIIGCDALIYQDVEALKRAVGAMSPDIEGFDASCFDGIYCTGDITLEEVSAINQGRNRGGEEDEVDTSRLSLRNAQEH